MSARPSTLTSTRPVRIVVAVAMIAVQLVLTASVGAFVWCGQRTGCGPPYAGWIC